MHLGDFFHSQRKSELHLIVTLRRLIITLIVIAIIGYFIMLLINVNKEIPTIVNTITTVDSISVPG